MTMQLEVHYDDTLHDEIESVLARLTTNAQTRWAGDCSPL